MARSRVKIDASDVVKYAERLSRAAQIVESEKKDFQQQWGKEWADEMRQAVPVASGKLRDSIQQIEPGGITFGDAFYWRFLEYGTAHMGPRPFIKPTMRKVRRPARADAGQRALKLLRK